MPRPKLKKGADTLTISFRDEVFNEDPDVSAANLDTEPGILDFIMAVISFFASGMITISLDKNEKKFEYRNKKRFRKPIAKIYSFDDIGSLQMMVYNNRGRLKVETKDNAVLIFTPNIKRRRLNHITKIVSEIFKIEPEIKEPLKPGKQV